MLSSGDTAIATTSDTAVVVIANSAGAVVRSVTVINEGAVAGFFSIDGGNTWLRLPAGSAPTVDLQGAPTAAVVHVKRVARGSDLSGIWAWAV